MKRISVRELRQNASFWLRRVQAGEPFEVTDRGRPAALLVPIPSENQLDRLLATGRLSSIEGDLLDLSPLPAQPDTPLPSTVLDEARAAER